MTDKFAKVQEIGVVIAEIEDQVRELADEYARLVKPILGMIENRFDELRELRNQLDDLYEWDELKELRDSDIEKYQEYSEMLHDDNRALTEPMGLKLDSYGNWVDWHSSAC